MTNMTLRSIIRRMISEEIGRNMYTIDPTPNTWDSFRDFEINYYPQDNGTCLLDVLFKNKKLVSTQRFGSQKDAEHHARMIVDKHRITVMNDPA